MHCQCMAVTGGLTPTLQDKSFLRDFFSKKRYFTALFHAHQVIIVSSPLRHFRSYQNDIVQA